MALTSVYVFPAEFVDDLPNRVAMNPISSTYVIDAYTLLSEHAYFSDLIRRQLSVEVRALAAAVTVFANHVACVLLSCSKNEMTRVAARRVIARVKHMFSSGIFTVDDSPTHPVSPKALAVPAVTLFGATGLPLPALPGAFTIDFCPKPGNDTFIHGNALLWVTTADACRRRAVILLTQSRLVG